MLDSGTPFLISNEIAWTAELPDKEKVLLANITKFSQQIRREDLKFEVTLIKGNDIKLVLDAKTN